MIVPAVGNDYDRFPRVLGLLHLAEREFDRIEQCRQAAGLNFLERASNVVGAPGKCDGKVGLLVEFNQESLVLGIQDLEEQSGSIARRGELIIHAAADIESQTDGKRNVVTRKMGSGLLHAVVKYVKIFLAEPEDEPVLSIGHRYRNRDEI